MAKRVEKTLLACTTQSRERELERGRRMREQRILRPAASRGLAMSDRRSFKFGLYVAGDTQNSARAMVNLRAPCRAHLPDQHEIEVIDVFRDPERAWRTPGTGCPHPWPGRKATPCSGPYRMLACTDAARFREDSRTIGYVDELGTRVWLPSRAGMSLS
jgi:hypothetical protein